MSWLPIMCFLACAFVTVKLWQRQGFHGTVVGEVYAVRLDVGVGVDGIIQYQQLELFQDVVEGQTLAVLDPSILQAQLKTIDADIENMKATLAADIARVKLQLADIQHEREYQAQDRRQQLQNRLQEHQFELTRRFIELEQAKLNLRQTKNALAVNRLELKEVEAQLDILTNLKNAKENAVRKTELRRFETRKDVIVKQIQNNEKMVEILTGLENNAFKRYQSYKHNKPAPIEGTEADFITPENIQKMEEASVAAEKAHLARSEEIQAQIAQMTIKAPISGKIIDIYKRPGSSVVAGDSIAMIAQTESEFILSYWREDRKIRPKVNMDVTIRQTLPGSQEFNTKIVEVGPTVEPVPLHQLSDPNAPEFGFLVKLQIPDEFPKERITPGELLHVIYKNDGSD